MNKFATTLLFVSALGASTNAQCPVGIYLVRDQRALDDFPIQYPQCEELDGLSVRQASAYNLAPLGSIKKIHGDASFDASSHFLGISGMSALKEIGGTLTVNNMDSILDFSGLETLERIGGDLIIRDNSQLTDLDGLFSLKEIGGKLEIVNNKVLTTLFNTTSLQYLGLTAYSDLNIQRNPALQDLNGLQSINEVKGKLLIQSNKILKNLDGLSGIGLVDSAISVYVNDGLENTDGLRNIRVCNGKIEVSECKSLKSIDFEKLESMKHRFFIYDNPALRRVDGMNSLSEFGGDLYITRNFVLDTIRAFNNLVEAGTLVDISTNGPLPDFGFLKSLKKVAGSMHLVTAYPVAFTGLDSLSYVGLDLELKTGAESLAGLEQLEYVGRRLYIGGDSLQNLSPLAKLDTVRELTVTYCQKLTSLSGIDNIDASALGQVVIAYNPKLSHCAVKSMCDFLEEPGSFSAVANTGACIDTAAIGKSCRDPNGTIAPAIGISGLRTLVETKGSAIEIHFRLKKESQVGIRVYDSRGNSISDRPSGMRPVGDGKTTIPMGDWNRGVYWVEVRIDSDKSIHKVFY